VPPGLSLKLINTYVYGIPAASCAILATLAPPPGGRTFPTAISLVVSISTFGNLTETEHPLNLRWVDTTSLEGLCEYSGKEVLWQTILEPSFLGLERYQLVGAYDHHTQLTLVTAVLTALTMTTSSAELMRRRARPNDGMALVMD
jgi:hypothetical protein